MSLWQNVIDDTNAEIKQAEADKRALQQKIAQGESTLAEFEERSGPVWQASANRQRHLLQQWRQELRRLDAKLRDLQAQKTRAQQRLREEEERSRRERERIQGQNLTKGGLVPAMIYPVDKNGNMQESYFATVDTELKPLTCMFNPKEYKIKKKNKYEKKGLNNDRTYNLEFNSDIKPRTLTLSALWFDTAESGEDVRQYTDVLFNYVEVQAGTGIDFRTSGAAIQQPPYVAFEWGTFRFMAVLTAVTIDFLLFKPDGTPTRAKATVTMKEFKHRRLYARQNPSSGGGPDNRIWSVSAGDRLDTIAAEVYGDATQWRMIARHNDLHDPLALRPGQTLRIPSRWEV